MTTISAEKRPVPFRPDRRVWLAGLPLDLLGEADILRLFGSAVAADDRVVLANLNLHGLYAALTTPEMSALLKAPDSLVHIDGMPIVWMARLSGAKLPERARNAHIDLIPKMLANCAAAGWRVAIVGSDAEGARENEDALARLAPGLQIKAFDGYFDMNDSRPGSRQSEIIAAIRAFRPALLLVGMGMPRQERWIAAVRDQLDVPVIMPVGGFADYFAGRTRTAPRFLGPLGLEWLYRLFHDPRRLAFRYLVEPILLLGLLVRETARGAAWGAGKPDAGR